MQGLHFRLDARQPAQRALKVELELGRELLQPGSDRLLLFLPAWTPGSYLIREYARHLHFVSAEDAQTGESLAWEKVAKNRFSVYAKPGTQRFRIRYEVYAHELSVRTSHLDAGHAYWNGACVALWPVDRRDAPCRLEVLLPDGWDLATALPREEVREPGRVFRAGGLDEVVDSPFVAGRLRRLGWKWRGVPHELVLEGLEPCEPPERLLRDVKAVVEEAAAVFGGDLPYDRYQFLALFSDKGRGGLEHKNCSTLLAPRTALRQGKSYRDFLSLVAHEFFHVWNVKRMRPQELWELDYEVENYTSMLWVAEGFTAYYDELLCRRAGILEEKQYLDLLAEHTSSMIRGHGRRRQSLSEASFDAWIRLYRPDENLRNSTQNYYVNGGIAALCLDLAIRSETDGERSLDEALASLYRETYLANRGYTRGDLEAALGEAAGRDMAGELGGLVDGPFDPQLELRLAPFGLRLREGARDKPYLGVAFRGEGTTLSEVAEGGPAFEAGLAPGDELLALDDLRITGRTWEAVYEARARAGAPLEVLLSRRGRIEARTVVPAEQPTGSLEITVDPEAGERAARLRESWLRARERPDL